MYERFWKRCFDVFLALFAMVALLPLIALIAVLIKLVDPGPVFYSHARVGQDGRLFHFFKFRSMPVGTASVPSDALDSIELTWLGRLIRRTNIDELPQLINILRGEMSVVGPRPPIESQVELIELRKKNGALVCRPGLTGLAQVESHDGMSVVEKARFDAEYASNVTFLNDLKIIARTFTYLLKPPPVY